MPQQLTICIACDNYKVSRYKKELSDLNINIEYESSFNSEITLLKVLSDKETISKLTKKSKNIFSYKEITNETNNSLHRSSNRRQYRRKS